MTNAIPSTRVADVTTQVRYVCLPGHRLLAHYEPDADPESGQLYAQCLPQGGVGAVHWLKSWGDAEPGDPEPACEGEQRRARGPGDTCTCHVLQ